MSIKRTIITTVAVLALVAVVAPAGNVGAVTAADLQTQINALLAQLQTLQGGTTPAVGTGACAGVTFSRNLTVGSTGSDVKCLQVLLNGNGFTVATTGAGSPGYETVTFGPRTLVAVKKFQAAKGFTPANQVGPMTRQALTALLGGTPGVPPVVTPTAGGLSVSLASDTPAAATVATNASSNFTKLLLTAGTGDVSVSRLTVTRTGLSANTDVINLKFVDAATGSYMGGVGSLNSDGQTTFTFVPALKISAGTTRAFYLKAGVYSSATAGHTVALGVSAASDIVSNATAVSGAFPVAGNLMSVISLTVGTVSIATDGTVADSAPNVGTTDVTTDQFKLTTGTAEAVNVETITAMRTGSASTTDTANIKLWNTTTGQLLSTVASWDAYDKAVFSNLNLTVDKGKTVRFKITVDVVNGAGSSKTVNTDVIDGTDVLVVAKGLSYGYYITPDIVSAFSGAGSSNQTIANGSLTISKSISTPATGKVATGSDVVLGVFDFDAKGEDVKITTMKVDFTAATLALSDITKVAVYDSTGRIVAGPNSVDSSLTASFTDTFIVPVGVHPYTVKATLADSISNNQSVLASILTPSSYITATGMLSNASITSGLGATVDANTLTVNAAALTVTTLGNPAARSVPLGTTDFVWATFSLDASSAGEGIQVTSITVTDSLGGSAAAGDIDNAELWADLTSANSVRGDAYETKISTTYQPSAATQAYTIAPALVVAKGTFVKVALIADLNSGGGSGNHTFDIESSGVSAYGATTGNTLSSTLSYVYSAKQKMSTSSGGTLTVTGYPSTANIEPVADIVIGGAQGVTLAQFKLAANNVEDLDLDQITFDTTNGTFASTLYFYDVTPGATPKLLGSVPGTTSGTVIFPDGTLTIPANGYKVVGVKADFYSVDGSTVTNASTVKFGLDAANNVVTTGKLSGSSSTNQKSSTNVVGAAMKVYKSKPTFAKNSASPSGALTPLSNQRIAAFDITAGQGGSIDFVNGTNSLKVYISANVSDTAQNQLSFNLKDSNGNTLDSSIQAAATNSTKALSTYVTFPFATRNLIVPSGQTVTVYVEADLSDYEDTGDSIQAYLSSSDSTTGFGVDGDGGNYTAEGSKIFRNNVTANTLTKSSN